MKSGVRFCLILQHFRLLYALRFETNHLAWQTVHVQIVQILFGSELQMRMSLND
jgi:hypothetical protein